MHVSISIPECLPVLGLMKRPSIPVRVSLVSPLIEFIFSQRQREGILNHRRIQLLNKINDTRPRMDYCDIPKETGCFDYTISWILTT